MTNATEPRRRKRFSTILYDTLSVFAVAIIALDTTNFFEFSPEIARYLRGGSIVLGAILLSDKLDIIRDKRRARRRRR